MVAQEATGEIRREKFDYKDVRKRNDFTIRRQ